MFSSIKLKCTSLPFTSASEKKRKCKYSHTSLSLALTSIRRCVFLPILTTPLPRLFHLSITVCLGWQRCSVPALAYPEGSDAGCWQHVMPVNVAYEEGEAVLFQEETCSENWWDFNYGFKFSSRKDKRMRPFWAFYFLWYLFPCILLI